MSQIANYLLLPITIIGLGLNVNLDGKYYNHSASDKIEDYSFKPGGTFFYYAECNYWELGKGTYKIDNRTLKTDYQEYNDKIKAHYETWTSKKFKQDSNYILLSIWDSKNRKHLDSVIIRYNGSHKTFMTKANGTVKIPRGNSDLIFNKLGYHEITIPKESIQSKATNGFGIAMQNMNVYIKENIKEEFKLKTVNEDTIRLDNNTFVKDIKPERIIIFE